MKGHREKSVIEKTAIMGTSYNMKRPAYNIIFVKIHNEVTGDVVWIVDHCRTGLTSEWMSVCTTILFVYWYE